MRHRPLKTFGLLLAAVCLLVGCQTSRQIRDPEYAAVANRMAQAAQDPTPAIAALPPVASPLAGPQPVETCIAYALAQNPDIQVGRKNVEAAAARVPQAASLQDPTVSVMGYPFYPAVPQTVGGRATAEVVASQAVPWFGKLDARAEVAEAETDMARRELAAAELTVIEQVKRAYYELYFIQKAIRITEDDQKLLIDLSTIAESRYRAGLVNQQDVLRSQVEVSNLNGDLIRLRQQLESGQARLAQVLHISPDTPIRAVEQISDQQVPRDLERLYQQAVSARPELQSQLAAISRDRRDVELARLNYYPDLAFSVSWMGMTTEGAMSPVADGIPDVGVGVMMNVPIYRQRLEAGVREAEAKTVASARKYDSLRDQTLQEVKDLLVQATSQSELIDLFRNDILPKSDQTLRVSVSAYESGKIDFLQLIDNWRQLLRFQVAYERMQSQQQQTIASLDRVVGGQWALENASINRPQPAPPQLPPPTPAPDRPPPARP
jgi:outer membrane protein, heavy metal efflux system